MALTEFLRNLCNGNGETATAERQRNAGNQAWAIATRESRTVEVQWYIVCDCMTAMVRLCVCWRLVVDWRWCQRASITSGTHSQSRRRQFRVQVARQRGAGQPNDAVSISWSWPYHRPVRSRSRHRTLELKRITQRSSSYYGFTSQTEGMRPKQNTTFFQGRDQLFTQHCGKIFSRNFFLAWAGCSTRSFFTAHARLL